MDQAVKVSFRRVSALARIPTRGSEKAAGYDLYAALEEPVRIAPHETVKIDTGLQFEIPDGYFAAIYARSGIAAKEGLKIRVKPFRFRWWEKVPKYLEGGDPLVMLVTAPFENVSIELPTGTKGNLGFHWVTITEMDGDTLWVSSWGTRCKMSVKELRRFNVILHFYAVSLENQTNIV